MHWTRVILFAATAPAVVSATTLPSRADDCGIGAGTPAGTLAAPQVPVPCRGGRQPVQLHPEPKAAHTKNRRPRDFEIDHTTVDMSGGVTTEIGAGTGGVPTRR
jgi:hypothetical protein